MPNPFSPRWDHLNFRYLTGWEPYYPASNRIDAIKALLGRLEPPVIAKLEKLNRSEPLYWFLPSRRMYGMVERFPNAPVIYLAEDLELLSQAAIIGTVAHELAHFMQGHLNIPLDAPERKNVEQDADDTVKAWGFENEIKAYQDESVKLDGIIRRKVPGLLASES